MYYSHFLPELCKGNTFNISLETIQEKYFPYFPCGYFCPSAFSCYLVGKLLEARGVPFYYTVIGAIRPGPGIGHHFH
jgi:hypothetical protein